MNRKTEKPHLIKLVPFMPRVYGIITIQYEKNPPIFRRSLFGMFGRKVKSTSGMVYPQVDVNLDQYLTGVTRTVYCNEYCDNNNAYTYLTKQGWIVRHSYFGRSTSQPDTTKTSDLLYHCSSLAPKGRFVFLSPGRKNVFGIGVYMAESPHWSYGNFAYVISRKQAESIGVSFDDNNYPKALNALKLRIDRKEITNNKTYYHCTVVDCLDTAQTAICQSEVFERKSHLTPKMWNWCKSHIEVKPSPCLGLKYRLIGLVLAIACLIIWRVKDNLKWFALAKFLIGPKLGYVCGWSKNIDLSHSELYKDWNSGRVESINKNTLSIRPSHRTTLFWLVGGLSATKQANGDYLATDVYDFHTQKGQNTILGDQLGYSWAWSGLPDDPTKIPSQVTFVYEDWLIEHTPNKLRPYIPYGLWNLLKDEQITVNFWRFIPKALKGKYIKQYEHNGTQYLMFNNDLWNALGGVPFTTRFIIPQKEVKNRY